MKSSTRSASIVFVTVGALLAMVAIRQSVPSASGNNVALRLVSTSGPAAQRLGNSGQFDTSNPSSITVMLHPRSAPVTSMSYPAIHGFR